MTSTVVVHRLYHCTTEAAHKLVEKSKWNKRGIGSIGRIANARIIGGLRKALQEDDQIALKTTHFTIWEASHNICQGQDCLKFPDLNPKSRRWAAYPPYLQAARSTLSQLGLSVA